MLRQKLTKEQMQARTRNRVQDTLLPYIDDHWESAEAFDRDVDIVVNALSAYSPTGPRSNLISALLHAIQHTAHLRGGPCPTREAPNARLKGHEIRLYVRELLLPYADEHWASGLRDCAIDELEFSADLDTAVRAIKNRSVSARYRSERDHVICILLYIVERNLGGRQPGRHHGQPGRHHGQPVRQPKRVAPSSRDEIDPDELYSLRELSQCGASYNTLVKAMNDGRLKADEHPIGPYGKYVRAVLGSELLRFLQNPRPL